MTKAKMTKEQVLQAVASEVNAPSDPSYLDNIRIYSTTRRQDNPNPRVFKPEFVDGYYDNGDNEFVARLQFHEVVKYLSEGIELKLCDQ